MAHILHKRSSVSAKVPLVTDLLDGEISINTYDGRLFIKKTANSVQSIVTLSNNYSDLINTPQDLQTSASPAFTNLSVTAATSSTSPSTGALTVSGGVGIGGALQVGGGLSVTNNGYTWAFNSVGKITLPPGGDIVNQSGVSVLINNAPALGTPISGNFSTGAFTWPTFNQNTTGTAAGLSSTLSVTKGGTGATSLAANSVILGNGLSAVQSVAPGISGNILTSDGTTWTSQASPISLPSQTSNSGKYLTTDGSTALWSTISSGLVATAIKTASYTASANELVRCNTTTSAFNITFPASPDDGTIIGIIDINNTFATNAITLLANGNTIEDDSVGFMLDVSGTYVSFMYTTSTANWRLLETPSGTSSAFWNGFTGSGNVVLSTSPTLVTPILGTPASGNLTNCTFPTLNQNTTGTAAGLSATLAIASGGTGLTTVGAAGNVLTSNGTTWSSEPAPISLPSQTGNATKYLTTDGTSASWNSIPKTVSVLTRNGSSVSTVSVSVNYVAVLSRSNISIQVSIT